MPQSHPVPLETGIGNDRSDLYLGVNPQCDCDLAYCRMATSDSFDGISDRHRA